MRVARTVQSDSVFAGNRAWGSVALRAAALDGTTRRRRVHEDGSLRVRFPANAGASSLEAVLVNTAGGMTGGDRFSVALTLEAGARMLAGTAAAEKVYRSDGPDTEVAVALDLGAGSHLDWLPQETILFDRARLNRRIDIDLAGDASLLLCEAVIFGREAMGETVNAGRLRDRWRLRRNGKLAFAETLQLDGDVAGALAQPAAGNGARAIATLLVVPGDDQVAARVRELRDAFAGEVGVSAWNGMALTRFCAADGARLRHDIVLVLAALGCGVPRLWLS